MSDRMRPAPRPLPTMTPDQLRQARRDMTPEERREYSAPLDLDEVRRMSDASKERMKKGGVVKKMASGGKVRGDGICRVKTKGRFC